MKQRLVFGLVGVLAAHCGPSTTNNNNTTDAGADVVATDTPRPTDATPTPDTPSTPDAPPATDVPASAGAIPLAMFRTRVVDTFCEVIFGCTTGGSSDLDSIRALFGDVAGCRRLAPRLDLSEVDDLVAQSMAGGVRYNAEAAGRCVGQIRASCSLNGDLSEQCGDVFTGSVPAGGMCWRSEECLGTHYCDHGNGGTRMCPGTCRPRVALGTACLSAAMCARSASGSASCDTPDGATTEPTCVEIRPGAAAAEGAPCGLLAGSSSSSLQRVGCATGLTCARGAGGARTCQRTLTAGMPCSGGGACAAGLLCLGGTCRGLTVRNNAGDACNEAMLETCNPYELLRCEAGRCVRPGDGTAGSRCFTGADAPSGCNEGLYCERTSAMCVARRALGAMCESNRECLSNSCENGVCVARICR